VRKSDVTKSQDRLGGAADVRVSELQEFGVLRQLLADVTNTPCSAKSWATDQTYKYGPPVGESGCLHGELVLRFRRLPMPVTVLVMAALE